MSYRVPLSTSGAAGSVIPGSNLTMTADGVRAAAPDTVGPIRPAIPSAKIALTRIS